MTVKELYNFCKIELSILYQETEAAAISKELLSFHLGINPNDLGIKSMDTVPDESINNLKISLHKLKTSLPLQYVTGEAWFYNYKFKVSSATLIPRPETEELVELCIKDCEELTPTILDIGSGTGCIPIVLQKKIPKASIYSVDVSAEAITVAEENNALNQTNVIFICSDFLDEKTWQNLPDVNIIISNPPYIPVSNKNKMQKQVTDFEPSLALFVPDENPLLFYNIIEKFARQKLLKDGKIFLETHFDNAKEVQAIFSNEFFSSVIHKDMSGNDRMVAVTQCR